MVVASASGERLIPAQDFFVGPDRDIVNMTVLNEGEILTAVRLPNEWANAEFYFEKVADRNVWDFALVNVAAAIKVSGGSITDARIVCGAVECIHSYSLIHDDLPCMDNDAIRRGKPSTHIKFGESTAVLAGSSLLTLAFEMIADKKFNISENAKTILIKKLAVCYCH